ECIGHRNELHVRMRVERLHGGPGPAPAAANEADPDRIVDPVESACSHRKLARHERADNGSRTLGKIPATHFAFRIILIHAIYLPVAQMLGWRRRSAVASR